MNKIIVLAIMALLPFSLFAQTIVSKRIKGSGPILKEDAFKKEKAQIINMLAQNVVNPKENKPSVNKISVKSVHNGEWISFLIEWKDKTKNDVLKVDEFGDQVAVEFPVVFNKDALPSPMMGNPGGMVNIIQWRAPFQRDLDEGVPTVKKLYPNAVIDNYPEDSLTKEQAESYRGAHAANNPVTAAGKTPVIDHFAEGWGTLTERPTSKANGKGKWNKGTWKVIITIPMKQDQEHSPEFVAGKEHAVSFALWDGGHKEIGSRKSWANWVKLLVGK